MRLGLATPLALATVLLLGGGASASATREGGTFRVAVAAIGSTGLPRFATIDPALAGGGLAEPIVLRPACATLMAYPDVRLPAGLRLVPDLAAEYPKRSNGGKTYTFTVRRGLRFSNGLPVRASSFTHAIDRILDPAMKSPIASDLLDVVGAQAVLNGKAASASGIAVRGDRLIIHLTKPNGDLPFRISSVCAVPPNLPANPEGVGAPLASPAPYYVAQYKPGQLVVLERNRFYRGGRPHHVDRFVVTLDNDETKLLAQIESGQADWAPFVPELSGVDMTTLIRKYGLNKSRFFIKPGFSLWTFVLNTSGRLFKDNLPLRRAVNLAIDRTALARSRGSHWGSVTDHYLPSSLTGYVHAPIYPLSRPDVAKARALARGHTRGGHATLYVCPKTFCATAGQILHDNLKAIGLDVEVHQFPSPVLFSKLATPGEPFDIGWIGYITSQPYDPGAELSSLFDGRTIPKPGTNQDFRDYSYFDSAHYNRLFDKAATLGARVRDRFYGRLDLDIARNAAPMAAYAFDNVFTLVSARTGCVVVNPGIDLTAVCLK
jgi:peptide/nickel transport system substrate-binding protein